MTLFGQASDVREAFRRTPHAAALLDLADRERAPLWLTGGFVRDILLRKGEARDMDFALSGDVASFAGKWASLVKGKGISLDPCRGTYRVAAKVEKTTWWWDFTALRGAGIEEDLQLRDFTVNAVGLSLLPPGDHLLDPTGGIDDLTRGVVRVIHSEAFEDDPIRRLRAYRFAIQLGFDIEAATLSRLPGKDLTLLTSGERIREELAMLLAAGKASDLMEPIVRGGLLRSLWPQNGPDLAKLSRFEEYTHPAGDSPLPEDLSVFLATTSTHGLTHRTLLKLLCLSMPASGDIRDDYVEIRRNLSRMGHDLSLGRKAIRFLTLALEAVFQLAGDPDSLESAEGLWLFFDRHGEAGLGGLILDRLFRDYPGKRVTPGAGAVFYSQIYVPDLERARPIGAEEVALLTGLPPGAALGRALHALDMACRLNRVRDTREARAFLENYVRESLPHPSV